jgi:hypothetical protein
MVNKDRSRLGICQFTQTAFLELGYCKGTTGIMSEYQIDRDNDDIPSFGIDPRFIAQYLLSKRFTQKVPPFPSRGIKAAPETKVSSLVALPRMSSAAAVRGTGEKK